MTTIHFSWSIRLTRNVKTVRINRIKSDWAEARVVATASCQTSFATPVGRLITRPCRVAEAHPLNSLLSARSPIVIPQRPLSCSLPPAFCTENAPLSSHVRDVRKCARRSRAHFWIFYGSTHPIQARCVYTEMLSHCLSVTLVICVKLVSWSLTSLFIICVKTSIDFISTTQRFIEIPMQSCYKSVNK